ncbi:carbon-nitrogen hydrolase [Zavarzinella formosa]|uniref:carbon-nitrogen hydrolase n=1 Tax=Zavarzinella formosa TaxID=360055 RepID=UPI0002F796A1|nr:carbon-nitrogen hydrolase [Zavarzinella formosa]
MAANEFVLGLVQMRCAEEPAPNLAKAIEQIHLAAKQGAQIVCLPELFLGPYFCNTHTLENFDRAEPIPGPSTEKLSLAAKSAGVVVVASIFERVMAGLCFNTAVVFDADGSMLGVYRKMHIPHDPLFFEKYYFRPGDLGFKVFPTKFGVVGTLICWDQWFPEGARLTAMKGAEVLVYPTAIGWHPREKAEFGKQQHDAWETIQRGHAIANGLYVTGINRVGFEASPAGDGLEFWGGSFVSDPFGVIVARGSHDKEELLIVPCKRDRMTDVRRNWPFFRDRRTDAYSDLTKVSLTTPGL